MPSSDRYLFERGNVNSIDVLVFMGSAHIGSDTSDKRWTIYNLSYDVNGQVNQIDVLTGVAWDDRNDLDWP